MTNKKTYQPGRMKTYTGEYVDLVKTDGRTINLADIAWGLGRIIRFNGQIAHNYTVAHHCVVMSHMVPKEYALEALLHDAAEAYTGDIIWPVKSYLDSITDNAVSDFENDFLAEIILAVCPRDHKIMEQVESGTYVKSDVIKQADIDLGQHEWATLERGDEFEANPEITQVMDFINDRYEEDYMYEQPWWAWLRRFHELTGTEYNYDSYVKELFPHTFQQPVDQDPDELRKEADALREDNGMPPMSDEEWESVLEQAEAMAKGVAGAIENDEDLKRAVL